MHWVVYTDCLCSVCIKLRESCGKLSILLLMNKVRCLFRSYCSPETRKQELITAAGSAVAKASETEHWADTFRPATLHVNIDDRTGMGTYLLSRAA